MSEAGGKGSDIPRALRTAACKQLHTFITDFCSFVPIQGLQGDLPYSEQMCSCACQVPFDELTSELF